MQTYSKQDVDILGSQVPQCKQSFPLVFDTPNLSTQQTNRKSYAVALSVAAGFFNLSFLDSDLGYQLKAPLRCGTS